MSIPVVLPSVRNGQEWVPDWAPTVEKAIRLAGGIEWLPVASKKQTGKVWRAMNSVGSSLELAPLRSDGPPSRSAVNYKGDLFVEDFFEKAPGATEVRYRCAGTFEPGVVKRMKASVNEFGSRLRDYFMRGVGGVGGSARATAGGTRCA
jgi:hypothetical protein